jgi:hypothetical protein
LAVPCPQASGFFTEIIANAGIPSHSYLSILTIAYFYNIIVGKTWGWHKTNID